MEGEAVGVIILVDAINTGSCLPLLASWGSPRDPGGPGGWLTAGCDLVARPCDLVAGPLCESRSRESRLFVLFDNCHQMRNAQPLPARGLGARSGKQRARLAAAFRQPGISARAAWMAPWVPSQF